MWKRKVLRESIALFWQALIYCGAAASAQTTGRIEGTVREISGPVLPGVTVEATSPKLQRFRAAVTDAGGRFRLPELPPGQYRVLAKLSGFLPEERLVTVSLDSPITLDLALTLAVSENVSVSAETRLLDVASTTTGTSYTSQVTAKLPVARNYADIVRSNPGVSTDKGETQGRSLALTIYGATSAENQWIIDGIDTTNVLKGIQGKAINNEFVEEVEVKTGGYQADYGGALGGVINVITKSGGNAFHGEVFAYYDSSAMRAQQAVTSQDAPFGMRITPDQRWDYGVDLGGFIVKDRLWFFGAYNRVDTPGTTSRYVGTDEVPETLLFPRDQTGNLYSGKLTWNVARGSTLVATVFSDPSEVSGAALVGTGLPVTSVIVSPDPGTWESRRELGGTDYGVRLSQLVGSAAVFLVQGSRHEDRFELFPSGAGRAVRQEDWTCDDATPGTPDDPCQIPVEPNSVSGGLGSIDGNTQRNSSRRDQFRADATFYLGGHEIKAGGGYQRGTTTSVSSFTGGQVVAKFNEHGQLYYRHDFYVRSQADPTLGDRIVKGQSVEKGAYLQDTWRVAPELTVSAGLRWDQEDLRDYRGATVLETTGQWQPRLGVVWDPSRNGTMKVYAFAGRFYYLLPTDLSIQAFGATVEQLTYNFDPVDRTPDPSVIGHPPIPPNTIGSSEQVDSGIKGIYQDELTVGIEKLLDPTLSVGLKATYRRLGRMIEDRCDLDLLALENNGSSCAIVNPGSSGRYARGDFTACNGLDGDAYECGIPGAPATPAARRVYRGIEIMVRKSVSRFWLQASYAYSSLRGNLDGGVNENFKVGQTDPGWTADFDYPPFWYQSDGRLFLDRPHQARLDMSYTTPFGLFAGLGAYVQSGAPLNKRGYFNAFYGGANVFLVPRGGAGRMPTLWEGSLTVGYPIAVGQATVTLQAYLYNVFNNQIRTNQDVGYTVFAPPEGYPGTLYDPSVPPNNSDYGKILNRQEPRLFRAAVRVSF